VVVVSGECPLLAVRLHSFILFAFRGLQQTVRERRLRYRSLCVQSSRSAAGNNFTGDEAPWPMRPSYRNEDSFVSSEWTPTVQPAVLDACYVRQTLREGQTVTHPGTVIVFGDVHEGATVKAGKDIIVWGR
jgi:septum formation inhibitor MinC